MSKSHSFTNCGYSGFLFIVIYPECTQGPRNFHCTPKSLALTSLSLRVHSGPLLFASVLLKICWLYFILFCCTLTLHEACQGVQTPLLKYVCTPPNTTGSIRRWVYSLTVKVLVVRLKVAATGEWRSQMVVISSPDQHCCQEHGP